MLDTEMIDMIVAEEVGDVGIETGHMTDSLVVYPDMELAMEHSLTEVVGMVVEGEALVEMAMAKEALEMVQAVGTVVEPGMVVEVLEKMAAGGTREVEPGMVVEELEMIAGEDRILVVADMQVVAGKEEVVEKEEVVVRMASQNNLV